VVTSARHRLLDEISALELRLLVSGLPQQTASLLDYDMTLQQLRAFAFVYAHGNPPIKSVAEALGVRPNVATGIVQRLVDRGLIERREDPDDRRVRLLALTGRGQALIDELAAIVLSHTQQALERLSDEQLRQLRDVFAAMGSSPAE